MGKNESFTTVRPKLAAILAEHGIDCQQVPNIWTPEKKAWKIELTSPAAQLIADFYSEIGRPIPKQVTDYLNEGAQNND